MTRLTMATIISLIAISLMFVGISYAKIDPKAILGVWLLDDGRGDVAKDSADQGKNGAINGNPNWVKGKFKQALGFDGQDDYVEVPVNLNDCPVVTATLWVYTNAPPPGERYQVLSNDAGSYGRVINLYPNSYWLFNTSGTGAQYFVTLRLGRWEHLAAIWTTENTKLYLDGKLVATGAGDSPVYNDATSVNIGKDPWYKLYYNGSLDDIALFNIALSEDDIKSIVSDGLGKVLGLAAVSPAGKLATTWASIKAK